MPRPVCRFFESKISTISMALAQSFMVVSIPLPFAANSFSLSLPFQMITSDLLFFYKPTLIPPHPNPFTLKKLSPTHNTPTFDRAYSVDAETKSYHTASLFTPL